MTKPLHRSSRTLTVGAALLACALFSADVLAPLHAAEAGASGAKSSQGEASSSGSKNIEIMDQKGAQWTDDAESPTLAIAYQRAQKTGANLDGVAVISLKKDETFVSETSIPASAPIQQGRIYVNVNGPVNTGMAIANDGIEPATISFYFTDSLGNDFGSGSFTLEPKRNIAAFANQTPFNLAGPLEGSLTFKSSMPVAVTALRGFTNERGEFLMTTLPVVSLYEDHRSSIVLPQFADGAGWSTQVILTNPTDSVLTGAVQFTGSESSTLSITADGAPSSTVAYVIAPRSSFRFTTANLNAALQLGYVNVIAADQNRVPEATAIVSYSNHGITVTEAGVYGSAPMTSFRTYAWAQGAVRSLVALANPSAWPAQATLELTAVDGLPTGVVTSMEIPAGGSIFRFIDELFPSQPNASESILHVVSSQAISASGLRVRSNERGDALMTAVPVTDDMSVDVMQPGLVFPLIVRGRGYSTQLVGR